jgi:DNA (cytosine-5)-methyltransferase 1
MKKQAFQLIENQSVGTISDSVVCLQESAAASTIPFPTAPKTRFKFIDLFTGIGGFRIAMQNLVNV